jgi:hypothetical protein
MGRQIMPEFCYKGEPPIHESDRVNGQNPQQSRREHQGNKAHKHESGPKAKDTYCQIKQKGGPSRRNWKV